MASGKSNSVKTVYLFTLVVISSIAIRCANNESISPKIPDVHVVNDRGWIVSYFFDQDKNETSDFSDYVLYFRSTGTFEALHNGITETGTWNFHTDDARQILTISIGASKPLSELNDDWLIIQLNDDFINLKDDNDTHLEELHLRPAQ